MMPTFGLSGAQRLLAMATACLAGVLLALLAQQVYDMQPCPWCILQRFIYLLIALVCVLAAFGGSLVRRAGAALALVLCGLGIASAVFQHLVAAKQASCNLTLADKIITALGLESLWPAMFQVTANCADSAVNVLGLPFEGWSLIMFSLLELVALSVLLRPLGAR